MFVMYRLNCGLPGPSVIRLVAALPQPPGRPWGQLTAIGRRHSTITRREHVRCINPTIMIQKSYSESELVHSRQHNSDSFSSCCVPGRDFAGSLSTNSYCRRQLRTRTSATSATPACLRQNDLLIQATFLNRAACWFVGERTTKSNDNAERTANANAERCCRSKRTTVGGVVAWRGVVASKGRPIVDFTCWQCSCWEGEVEGRSLQCKCSGSEGKEAVP